MSEDLNDYELEQLKEFALKHIKSKNNQITYYHSENGKQKYRECARRYYYNNVEKCREYARNTYLKKQKELGKKVRKTRGRPKKNDIKTI